MAKKVPMRTCIGCGQNKEKKELIRIVHTPDGKFVCDSTGRAQGRGCYICRSVECFEEAVRKKAFSRSFRENVPVEVCIGLREEFSRSLNKEEHAG